MVSLGTVESILLTIVTLWLGGIQWAIRSLKQREKDVPTRQEVKEIVRSEMKPHEVLVTEVKEDVKEMKEDVKALVRLQMQKNNNQE